MSAQTNYDTSPKAQTGQQVYGSYFGTDVDSISLYNGNLNVNIGLVQLPGRELSMGLSFGYNNQKWEEQICYSYGFPYSCGLYTGGWRLQTPFGSQPSIFWTGVSELSAFWIDARGTKHRYIKKDVPVDNYVNNITEGLTLTSMDSDGSTFFTGDYSNASNPIHPYVAFKDGSILKVPSNMPGVNHEVVTVHGNKLIRPTSAGPVLPTQDTLGRTIQHSCASCWTQSYTVLDSNNVNRTYTIVWTALLRLDPFSGDIGYNYPVLQSITLPNGKSYQFEYAHPQGFMTKLTFPSGAYIKYVYSDAPNDAQPGHDQVLKRIVSADGTVSSEKTWIYSGYAGLGTTSSARTVTVTSPEGDKIVHTFNAQGEETQTQWQTSTGVPVKTVNSTWSQDSVEANNQPNNPKVNTVVTTTDGNLKSQRTITYDPKMNVTQEKVTDWGFLQPGPLVSQKDLTYQNWPGTNLWRVASETMSAINPATGVFEQQGKTEYLFDEYGLTQRTGVVGHDGRTTGIGNVTTVKRYKDATNYVAEHMYYDNVGNVVQTLDPLNNPTTIDFADNFSDATKNGGKFAYPKKVTNALSQFTTTKYDYNTGLPVQVTDLRGNHTTTAYDLLNRVVSIVEPNGKETTYAYDDTALRTTKEVTVDDAGNKGHVETQFDRLYRVVQTRTNDPEGQIWVDTVYDGKGRKKQVSNPYRGTGTPTPCTGASVCTTTTYDAMDRPVQIQAPDGSTVQYAYSGNQTKVTDEAGNERRYTYNILGQMTTVEEPYPTLATPLVTTYSYYGFGPLYRSNQSNQLRTFLYNWLGQMTSQTLPESGTTTFIYDGAGQLTSKTDARLMSVIYCYDELGRMIKKMHSGTCSAPISGLVTWTYDGSTYTGLRTSMTDGLGSVTYAYDNMNRLTLETRTLSDLAGRTFSTGYGYNKKGDLTSLTYPSGRVVQFNMADAGGCCNSRLKSVVDQTTGTTLYSTDDAGVENYNAAGQLLQAKFGNDVVQRFEYNSRLQNTSITASLSTTTLMSFNYNYGTGATNTGRVLSRTDAIQPEHSANYSYDSLYRLDATVNPAGSWGLTWTFDVWGNRLLQTPLGLAASKVGTQSSSYSNNRLQTSCFGQAGDCYDAAGNMINDGASPTAHNYAFNAENQITQMDGGTATYGYDGEGRRMKKTVDSETTYSFYGPGGVLCEFGTSSLLSSATGVSVNDNILYRTNDKLGTAVLLMNIAATIIEDNRTLPYGEPWLAENTSSLNNNKFATYERDTESGLDYAMNRYVSNGRFKSIDQGPMHLYSPRSLNRYVYGFNDPLNSSDPDGNIIKCPENPACPPPPPEPEPESGGGKIQSPAKKRPCTGDTAQLPDYEQLANILSGVGLGAGDWVTHSFAEQASFLNVFAGLQAIGFSTENVTVLMDANQTYDGIAGFNQERTFFQGEGVQIWLSQMTKANGFGGVNAFDHPGYDNNSFKADFGAGSIQFSFSSDGTRVDVDIDPHRNLMHWFDAAKAKLTGTFGSDPFQVRRMMDEANIGGLYPCGN